jgi:hypothetical protein
MPELHTDRSSYAECLQAMILSGEAYPCETLQAPDSLASRPPAALPPATWRHTGTKD